MTKKAEKLLRDFNTMIELLYKDCIKCREAKRFDDIFDIVKIEEKNFLTMITGMFKYRLLSYGDWCELLDRSAEDFQKHTDKARAMHKEVHDRPEEVIG